MKPEIAMIALIIIGVAGLAALEESASRSNGLACTEEAKICDDGSYVGRNPKLNCQFDPCPGDQIIDHASVINQMRDKGIAVSLIGEVQQPSIPASGQKILANGDEVQIFEFESLQAAESFRSSVSKDGTSIGTAKPEWTGTPLFYQSGKMVALHFGSNENVRQALNDLFGPPFAGFGNKNYCTAESRTGDFCIELYAPVCGWFDPAKVQCFKYPCAVEYSNSCFACQNADVLYWTPGSCPQ